MRRDAKWCAQKAKGDDKTCYTHMVVSSPGEGQGKRYRNVK